MSDKKGPSHRVFAIDPRSADGSEDYLRIGSAFEHSDGKGYNLVLNLKPEGSKLILRDVDAGPPKASDVKYDMKKPVHSCYFIEPRTDEKGDDDNFWHQAGGSYACLDGKGFVVLTLFGDSINLSLRDIKEPQQKGKSKR